MTASRAKILTSKLLVVVIALSVTLSTQAHSANQPRKILTGWIPYYSMKTSLPAALNNADLIKEVMPFWYTLKYNGKTKAAYVSDLYVTGNPSIPIATPLAAMRAAGFQIIPVLGFSLHRQRQ